jgi:hypothetical protein
MALQGAGYWVAMSAIWGLCALGVLQLSYLVRRHFWRRAPRSGTFKVRPVEADLGDPTYQLKAVMAADFSAKRVMSLEEYRVFAIVEQEAALLRGGYRVFAQTALGEVLRTESSDAFRSINGKRADVLVVSPQGLPVVAVEYQGKGHYQGSAAVRDAVKREALRKAGVDWVEVSTAHTPDDARAAIRAALRRVSAPRLTPA